MEAYVTIIIVVIILILVLGFEIFMLVYGVPKIIGFINKKSGTNFKF